MKLPRPYIPYSVRVIVAARQAFAAGVDLPDELGEWPRTRQLRVLLRALFGNQKVHLDHDPPLMLRLVQRRDGKIVRYNPDANDPAFLIYRTKQDHKIKTYVRGDGAQRSDASQRRYLKRVARNRSRSKRKRVRSSK